MLKSRIQFFISPQSRGHSYFITEDEELFSFGNNLAGQLSLGEFAFRKKLKKPEVVEFFDSQKIKNVFSGYDHSFIQTENGNVFGVGNNRHGQLSCAKFVQYFGDEKNRRTPTLIVCFGKKKIQKIFCGESHSVFVVENKIYSSGDNYYGQLGIGSKKFNQFIAGEMKINSRIIDIECGFSCTFLISSKNELFKTGRICKSDTKCLIPTLISEFPKEEEIKKISCGYRSCLILCKSKKVFGIGDNRGGNLTKKFPKSSIIPIEIKELVDIIDIKCGEFHSLVLDKNFSAFGIGCIKKFLGLKRDYPDSNYIALLKRNIIQIESGRYQIFLFDRNNDVWVGGRNQHGSLGFGKRKNCMYELLQKNILIKCKVKKIIAYTIPINRLSFYDVIIKL